MSFSPVHLVRSRFSAGLSCAPQHRIRLGRLNPQRAHPRAVRYVGHDVSTPNTTAPGATGLHNDVKAAASHNDVALRTQHSNYPSTTSTPAAIEREHQTVSEQSIAEDATQSPDIHVQVPKKASRGRRPTTRRLAYRTVRRIVNNGGFETGQAHHVYSRVNSQIKYQKRWVSPRSVNLEALIRLRSLYPRFLALNQWTRSYRYIFLSRFYNREMENEAQIPKVKGLGSELLEKIQQDCLGSFREAWHSLERPQKAEHWMRLMFWLLINSPELSLLFLLVTSESTTDRPNFSMVAESLLYLDVYHAEQLKKWQKDNHTYQSVIQTCLNPRDWPILTLSQKGVRLYLKRCDREAVYFAWKIIHERQIQMRAETALCFMRRFTEFGDVDMAIKALQFIPILKQAEFGLDSQGVSRHCSKLLTLDSVVSGSRGRNFRILPRLLEMGVRPDRDMMNVVLSNAYKTGDHELGLDMLNFMRAQNQELDSYSYMPLLHDAVARGDRERTNALIQEIEGVEKLRNNPFLESKIFHAHYVFNAKHLDVDANPQEVFYSILGLYNQMHDITPLKDLSIIPHHYTPPPGSGSSPPSLVALYIMIATYFRCQKRSSNVHRIYTKFRQLVLQGHPIIAPLAATDHTYNEFLFALRDDPRGLRLCVRLVEDMLQSDSIKVEIDGKEVAHAKPSVRTWTILLSAFVYNKQPLAAEKVKDMMAKHAVKFNEVTWNVVISGYANAQNVPEVAKSMRMMEEQGFTMDEYTMKSLRYLRDPERLWVAVEELDNAAGLSVNLGNETEEATQEREMLLDQGLRRLEAKMKPKL